MRTQVVEYGWRGFTGLSELETCKNIPEMNFMGNLTSLLTLHVAPEPKKILCWPYVVLLVSRAANDFFRAPWNLTSRLQWSLMASFIKWPISSMLIWLWLHFAYLVWISLLLIQDLRRKCLNKPPTCTYNSFANNVRIGFAVSWYFLFFLFILLYLNFYSFQLEKCTSSELIDHKSLQKCALRYVHMYIHVLASMIVSIMCEICRGKLSKLRHKF